MQVILNKSYPIYFKKIFIVISCIVLFLGVITIEQKKAEAAWPLALPAGIQIGGGIYVLGALAVGTVGAAVGWEYADEINEHARNVWESTTELAESSMQSMLDLANSTGDYMQKVGSDFTDWALSKVPNIASYSISVRNKFTMDKSTKIEKEFTQTVDNKPVSVIKTTSYPNMVLQKYDSSSNFVFPQNSTTNNWQIATVSGLISAEKITVQIIDMSTIGGDVSQNYIEFKYHDLIYSMSTGSWFNETGYIHQSMQKIKGKQVTNNLYISTTGYTTAQLQKSLSNIDTAEELIAFMQTLGLDNVTVGNETTWDLYNQSLKKLQRDIPLLKDAGMVIPVNDIVARPIDNPNKTLEYKDDAWYLDGVPYTGQIEWDGPKIGTITVNGVEVPVTMTSDGTAINIYTGEVVTGDPGVNPPTNPGTDLTRPNTKLNLLPLMMTGELMQEKFPFSIPFDFVKQLEIFNVEPEAPIIKVNISDYLKLDGFSSIPMKFTIDLTMFDVIADIIRWGNVILFDIGLIFMIRRFMPE